MKDYQNKPRPGALQHHETTRPAASARSAPRPVRAAGGAALLLALAGVMVGCVNVQPSGDGQNGAPVTGTSHPAQGRDGRPQGSLPESAPPAGHDGLRQVGPDASRRPTRGTGELPTPTAPAPRPTPPAPAPTRHAHPPAAPVPTSGKQLCDLGRRMDVLEPGGNAARICKGRYGS